MVSKKKNVLKATGIGAISAAFLFAGAVIPAEAQVLTPQISNVNVTSTGATSTIITWSTDVKTDSLVNFSPDPSFCTVRNSGPAATDHSVTVPNLDPGTNYYFRIAATDESGNQSFSTNYTFATAGSSSVPSISASSPKTQQQISQQILDLLKQIKNPDDLKKIQEALQKQGQAELEPPKILGLPTLDIGPDRVTLTWTTDKAANSIVHIAADGDYNRDPANPYTRKEGDSDTYTTDHKVEIPGLSPTTVYHYELDSRAEVGPSGVSPDYTFTTKSFLPAIRNVRLLKVEEHSATISWMTDYPASGELDYTNMSTRKQLTFGDPTVALIHSIQLENLDFQTRYQVVIKAKTESGDEVASDPIFFLTVKNTIPPLISQVANDSTLYASDDTKVQTVVSWQTDDPAECSMSFTEGVAVTDREHDPSVTHLPMETDYLIKHVAVVTEFSPATVYKYWLTCSDTDGNATSSSDFVLLTPQKEKNIIDVILGNFKTTFGWLGNFGG